MIKVREAVTPTVTRNAPKATVTRSTVTRRKHATNAERQKAYRARKKARQ